MERRFENGMYRTDAMMRRWDNCRSEEYMTPRQLVRDAMKVRCSEGIPPEGMTREEMLNLTPEQISRIEYCHLSDEQYEEMKTSCVTIPA